MKYIDSIIPNYIPQRPGDYSRISADPWGLERGVTRQDEDNEDLRVRLRWGAFAKRYCENDTTAFRKQRITLPDGKVIKRVIRPKFTEMLHDFENQVIDGILFHDLDRLLRQPRDLEDLIDVVESTRRPVKGATSDLDLLTSSGRANARMLVAIALKSSEDTQRRVIRAKFQEAVEGRRTYGGYRPFGWQDDRLTLHPKEALILNEIVKRVMAGENLSSITCWLQEESGIPPTGMERPHKDLAVPREARWQRTVVAQMLRAPRLAGIRTYRGAGHGENPPGPLDWERSAMRSEEGLYVAGPWQAILTVDEWEDLNRYLDAQRKNGGGGWGSRKYLLSSIARCGRCGAGLVGTTRECANPKHSKAPAYVCPPKSQGGCNGVTRHMGKMDELIETLVIRHMEEEHADELVPDDAAEASKALEQDIERIDSRKAALRASYASGEISPEDFFPTLKLLDVELKERRSARVKIKPSGRRSVNPREEWRRATLAQRRAILKENLIAVQVLPTARSGRGSWNPDEIVPIWRD